MNNINCFYILDTAQLLLQHILYTKIFVRKNLKFKLVTTVVGYLSALEMSFFYSFCSAVVCCD